MSIAEKAALWNETTAARLSRFDVRLEYWLRRGTGHAFEETFVRAVLAWLEDAWWFQRPVFGSRRAMTARRALYEALGLKGVAVLMHKDEPRRFHFHAYLTSNKGEIKAFLLSWTLPRSA